MVKAHGLRGEVVVELITDRVERLAPGSRLLVGADERVVSSSRPHQGRWLVVFDGVVGREAADALRGSTLRAEALDGEPDVLWVHQLIGVEVVTLDGVARGRVVAVEANPASDLLVLDTGGLVPLRFVDGVVDGVATVDVPAGLFDDDE